VNVKVGPAAVARAIRNLVLTNFYDRPFQSYIGSNASKLLFENITPMTAILLQQHIEEVITNFEPRVGQLHVLVSADNDRNGYNAKMIFTVENRPEPFTSNLFLERVR
jgi:phage baseplate assembly protein W